MLMGSLANTDGSKKSAFNKEKWLPLVYLPFKISHYCCNVMKKSPLGIYQRQTGRYPIVGTMASESRMRKQAWLRHGCNAFNSKKKVSAPLSFWTEQDILQYIKQFDIDICSVYGKIETLDNGQLHCTGCQRSGCVFCGFGCHLEKGSDRRFLRLKETHPQLYDYCMRGGRWEDNPDYIPDLPEYDGEWRNWNPEKIFVPYQGLGLATVFDMINEIYGVDFIEYK
jgi:3'-phosphoadenosine 5'-phosphosulfate sulfotransferase (PAPS reductase)/FAD synthetase